MNNKQLKKTSKIYVAGHKGMVGSAVCRLLEKKGYTNLIYSNSTKLDLRDQLKVKQFFQKEEPEAVISAAAVVGGILANNNFPYQFIMDNMQIQNNLIDSSFKMGVEKFIFLGSSCIYPKLSPQPIKEEYLLTDKLEPTNQWYAVAKISGVKTCETLKKQYKKDYVSLMPSNLYGYHDNFSLETSHVLPAIIRKIHDAKVKKLSEVRLFGSGKPLREFLFIDDMAEAVIFALENNLPHYLYNIGTGISISIKKLVSLIQKEIGYDCKIVWDTNKPNGTHEKTVDVSRINEAGWRHSVELSEGIKRTYSWFLDNISNIREVSIKIK